MKVKIYIEGGGDGSVLDGVFREAWSRFFEKAGLKGRMPRPVRGKGRRQTWDLFASAIRNRKANELPLMLVDSEDLVAEGKSVWGHLEERKDDSLDPPPGASEDHAFLMISAMETWIVADRGTLRKFFHPNFREHALPKWPQLELVPRHDVLAALKQATGGCRRPYEKGAISFDILGEIDPSEVERACPAAKRLLDRLRQINS